MKKNLNPDKEAIAKNLQELALRPINRYLYYQEKRHVGCIPTLPESARADAIKKRIQHYYPNQNINLDEVTIQLASPVARFDSWLEAQHGNASCQLALEQFSNQILALVYAGQPQNHNTHFDLKQALLMACESVKINDEYRNQKFQLIAFSSKYIRSTVYAFIGHTEPLYGCVLPKDVKSTAQCYMDDALFSQWFGANLSVVK
ncbi:hypothetical protein DXX93_18685 [Thalassotalea euphylliae]|uniref:Uncharacterized protein n=1 Tax=Thalassotalea euphylliae TaxID=1655234 RepID=A0A3E0TVA7_9GAMM|nr:hypothetical protein [Thalassotalea euphylliae]REL28390.1 hypothetical protein DXX93_18685 [Thalassotalea euphylliae]